MLEQGVLSFALLGAEWVLWVLVAMSVGCIALSFERLWYLSRDATDRSQLAAAIDAYFKGGATGALAEKLRQLRGYEARILSAGLEVAELGEGAAEKALSGQATAERLKMERGLSFLATVGSNAPFVGLFGTVLGIVKAFHDLAESNSEASEAVMAGISEALVATAVGLMVAIPAVVLYNIFNRWVRTRLTRTASVSDLMLARLARDAHPHGR